MACEGHSSRFIPDEQISLESEDRSSLAGVAILGIPIPQQLEFGKTIELCMVACMHLLRHLQKQSPHNRD